MSSKRQKLIASVNWQLQSSLKHITELITGNKYYHRGGHYRQVSLYLPSDVRDIASSLSRWDAVYTLSICFCCWSGGRLNKKDRLTGYGDSHVKDKTSYRPSYLYHGNPHTWKDGLLYWDGALAATDHRSALMVVYGLICCCCCCCCCFVFKPSSVDHQTTWEIQTMNHIRFS